MSSRIGRLLVVNSLVLVRSFASIDRFSSNLVGIIWIAVKQKKTKHDKQETQNDTDKGGNNGKVFGAENTLQTEDTAGSSREVFARSKKIKRTPTKPEKLELEKEPRKRNAEDRLSTAFESEHISKKANTDVGTAQEQDDLDQTPGRSNRTRI